MASGTTRAARSTEAVETAARLRLTITRLARRLRQQADMGLSPSQLSALSTIDEHGPIVLGALAAHERVAAPTVTRVVKKLEERAFVARTIDPVDRRVARVAITAAGRDLLAESRRRKTAWLAERLAALDTADFVALENALDALDTLLTEHRP